MACSDSSVSCWITNQTQVIVNIANTMVPIEKLITGGAYVIGIGFAIKAIMSLKQVGESRSGSGGVSGLKEPVIYFLVASMLIYFPTGFAVLMNTTFGYSNVLSYQSISDTSLSISTLFSPGSQVGESLALIIQVVGMAAFVRGWMLIARTATSGQPPGGTGKGITHIFGGILAMNIVGTLQIINNTIFGT